MAATHLFTCLCGIQKKTSNHWILATVASGSIKFVPWDIHLAMRDEIIVLCGERCAAALLSRSLGDWKSLDAVREPVCAAPSVPSELALAAA